MPRPQRAPQRKPRRGESDGVETLVGRLARAERTPHLPSTRKLREPDPEVGDSFTADLDADPDPESDEEAIDSAVSTAAGPSVEKSVFTYRDTDEAADSDRLWDWIRGDADGGLRFLGVAPATSAQMRDRLHLYREHLTAIDCDGVHVGFLGFSPVTDTYVTLQVYLESSMRGQLPALAPLFIVETQGRFPGLRISILAADTGEVQLYSAMGFTVNHILTLAPSPSV